MTWPPQQLQRPIAGMSIVRFDDAPIAAIISPQLTTVRQPISELAARAVSLLSDNISRRLTGEKDENTIFLDHSVIERDSAAPPLAQ